MPELLIRPSLNDHKVVADLVAPSLPSSPRPLSRIVLTAQDAPRQPEFGDLAAKSGVPLLIDPMTTLIQGEQASRDPWVQEVPYGRAAAIPDPDLADPFFMDDLVARALEFQVEHGATAVIPPYFYAERPDSPAFAASLTAIARTAKRMRSDGVSLPVVPILCAQLRGFVQRRPDWQRVLDRFAAAALDIGPQAFAMYLSPIGDGKENYSKILHLFLAARHLASSGVPVIAWRQGAYGPALVAAGVSGYECGMGIGEQSNVRGYTNQHKPRDHDRRGGSGGGVYIPAFGRSLQPKVARVLLGDRRLKGRLVCADVRCCPRGAESMVASKGRRHAVRARAGALAELARIPDAGWRLRHVSQEAASAHVLGAKANELLAAAGMPERIHTDGYASLEQAVEYLRSHTGAGARDTA